jgi:hypothetical protein
MQPEQPGRLRAHHDLITTARIGHPACDDGDPVLIEVQAVDTANGRQLQPRSPAGCRRATVTTQHIADRPDADRGPPDLGQMSNHLREGRQTGV